MSVLDAILLAALGASLLALGLTLANLRRYRPAPDVPPDDGTLVSVCVPARNEAANLEPCVRGLLASVGVRVEVLVYDDESTDDTPRILERLEREDPRVRRVPTVPLPAGWNGKQWGCWRSAQAARGAFLLFTDADVRFEPACVSRALGFARASGASLVSTFPRQLTGSLGEALLVPMIFFLLMGYLPMGRMRRTRDPGSSAGCGQFLLARADDYRRVGGHERLKDSMHDGIKLPRVFRRAGLATDLFDAGALCRVRMYRGFGAAWRGFAKNAYEGLGHPALLVFLTVVHAVGHVLPWGVVAWWFAAGLFPGVGAPDGWAVPLAAGCVACHVAQRLALAARFAQPAWVALAHPVGVTLMTLVQWHSFVLALTGRRTWKGRSAPAAGRVAPG